MSFTGFARLRKELAIKRLRRSLPRTNDLKWRQEFARYFIKDEAARLGDRPMCLAEGGFADMARQEVLNDEIKDVLCGMLIRGRVQAAVFNVFMRLCSQGICSLSALEYPIDWDKTPTDVDNVEDLMTACVGSFAEARRDWKLVQDAWGIISEKRWIVYHAAVFWLMVMIGRSFTSVDMVVHVIRSTSQLGLPSHYDAQKCTLFRSLLGYAADPNLRKGDEYVGNGTFAFWLPENVDGKILERGFDYAARLLSRDFYQRLERMEMHYAAYFNISREEFDLDIKCN